MWSIWVLLTELWVFFQGRWQCKVIERGTLLLPMILSRSIRNCLIHIVWQNPYQFHSKFKWFQISLLTFNFNSIGIYQSEHMVDFDQCLVVNTKNKLKIEQFIIKMNMFNNFYKIILSLEIFKKLKIKPIKLRFRICLQTIPCTETWNNQKSQNSPKSGEKNDFTYFP